MLTSVGCHPGISTVMVTALEWDKVYINWRKHTGLTWSIRAASPRMCYSHPGRHVTQCDISAPHERLVTLPLVPIQFLGRLPACSSMMLILEGDQQYPPFSRMGANW